MAGRTALALALLAACGDNITGVPFEDLDALAASARCERLTRCGLFAERATCDAYFRKRPDLGLAAAVDANKVLYNGVAAEACHAALAAQSCDDSSREVRVPPPVCAQVFRGTLAEGAVCNRDEECVSGACTEDALCPPQMCCPGTCVANERVAIDEPCSGVGGCVDDAFCGPDGVCHALGKVADQCRRDSDCDYNLGCIGATELMPGRCRELPLIGNTCLFQRCGEIGATCKAQTCVALGLAGAACVSSADCSPFTQCDAVTNTCKDLPSLGMPCTSVCAGESYCEPTLRMCVMPQANTSPCNSHDQCESLYCNQGPVFDSCETQVLCF